MMRIVTLFFLVFSVLNVRAQLEITNANTPPFTPENLISNVFLGEGVEVTNINFGGDNEAVGFFTNGTDAIGIDRGIILSTGYAQTLGTDAGGELFGSNFASTNLEIDGPNDPDLATLTAPFGSNDVQIYTLQFVPTSDTVRFRYVFASEEYPEFACTSFNDAFGFFISGPGISGPFQNGAENIALIPGTDIPVTINNINGDEPGNNCPEPQFPELFVTNNNQGTQPTYDGFTRVFTAMAVVTPCETYTLKIAIADAGDSIYDSAVFLEARSFGTGQLDVEFTTLSLDGTVVEGCAEAEVTFELPNAVSEDFVIDYQILGTAENGVDYQMLPETVTIPAGDSVATLPIIAFEDGLIEGIETIGFDVQRDPCTRDTFYVFLDDNNILAPDLPELVEICQFDSVLLDASLPIPLPDPIVFRDSIGGPIGADNPLLSELNVFGVVPFDLQAGVIESVCLTIEHRWLDDLDIFLIAPNGAFLELVTDVGANGDDFIDVCFTEDALQFIDFTPPPADAALAPFTGEWLPEGPWSDLYGAPSNGTWGLQIVDDQDGFDDEQLIEWSITFNPTYQLTYEWAPTDGLSCADCDMPFASPDATTTYFLTVTDSYGCPVFDTVTVDVTPVLDAPALICELTSTSDNNCLTWSWDDLVGVTDGYEVSVDGGPWTPPSDPALNEHTICNLFFNDTLTLQVRGLADCPSQAASSTCWTPDCDGATPTIDALVGVDCFGDTDGMVVVTATGGFGDLTYTLELEPGNVLSQDNGTFSGLPGGNFTVGVTDESLCTIDVPFTISEPDALDLLPTPIAPTFCSGTEDGRATVVVNGGTAPFSFAWSNGEVDSIAVLLPGGENMVTVTDASDCTASVSVFVLEPSPLNADAEPLNESCAAEATGSAIGRASGGNPFPDGTYLYQWDANAAGQTQDTAFMLGVGTYFVTITDSKGCSAVDSVDVEPSAEIGFNVLFTTELSGCGAEDGSIVVSAFSATTISGTGFTYSWSNGASGQALSGVGVGLYILTATEMLTGCSDTLHYLFEEPASFTTDVTTTGLVNCFGGNDGEAIITPSGNTNYNFEWSDIGTADSIRTDLSPGVYSVTVTDLGLCSDVVSFTIDAPAELELELTGFDPSCADSQNGEVTAVVSGGVPPYSFAWSANAGGVTDSLLTDLSGGVYELTVTDDNGCSITGNITLTQPDAATAIAIASDVSCFGDANGIATVSSSIGPSGTIQWSAAAGSATTNTVMNLAPGIYFVTVTDADGLCSATAVATVGEPAPLETTTSVGSLGCNGATNGTASVNPVGGTPGYTYAWSNGQTTQEATGLLEQLYYVTVTDANGCTAVDSVDVAAPEELTVDISGDNLACFDDGSGTITVVAGGGSGGFSYTWNDPNIGDTPTPTGLSAGDYAVTVTDANGCEVDTTLTLTQPDELTLSLTKTDLACFGDTNGTINASVQGGSGGYIYTWSNAALGPNLVNLVGGTYALTVEDADGCTVEDAIEILEPTELTATSTQDDVLCYGNATGAVDLTISGGTGAYDVVWTENGTPVATTEDLTDVVAGVYTAQITDANGCFTTLNAEVDQPDEPVTLTIVPSDTICFGTATGELIATITGGTGPFQFIWSHGALTQTATALNAGLYDLTVADAGGCEYFASSEVVETPEIEVLLDQTGATCHDGDDGTAFISEITYGQLPIDQGNFTFMWSTTPVQTTPTATGLIGGIAYAVTITDGRQCTGTGVVDIDNPEPVEASIADIADVSCFAGSDGAVTVQGDGGSAPYTYFWTGNPVGQDDATLTGLSAGTFSITVADAFDCRGSIQVEVDQPTALVSDIEQDDVGCFGDATGAAQTTVIGGTAPYNYAWTNGGASARIENLTAGDYAVVITDDNGCTLNDSIAVTQPDAALTALADPVDATCFESIDGQIFVAPDGGTAPYQFSVDGGAQFFNTNHFVGLTPGVYDLIARDARGCVFAFDPIEIFRPDPILIDLPTEIVANVGFTDPIELNAQVENATDPVSYQWRSQFGDYLSCDTCAVTFVDSLFDTNIFTVFVTDAEGCTGEQAVRVKITKEPRVVVPTGFSPNGDGTNDLLLVHGKSDIRVLSMQIFDRWGELVYEAPEAFMTNQTAVGWDGTFRGRPAPIDAYIYLLEVEYLDGQREFFRGETTIVR